MCGFSGRFHAQRLPDDPEWGGRADALLFHRGPDGGGAYADERCQLVHRRLALIDLSPTGHQPMANHDGSVVLMFNGEIYNHPALRAELQSRGYQFRGRSDTEVIVHLYEEYGEEMLERLRGMFALAIYDRPRRRIVIARDRFGIKPLYYASLEDQFVFASEMKAILALRDFRPTLDRQASYDYLGLGYVPEPATGFNEIRALRPGTSLAVSADGERLETFHRVVARADPARTLDEAVDAAGRALAAAVKQQVVADVPVAALLSGGLDSSLVVAAQCRTGDDPPATFTVAFPDAAYDESGAAETVARHCRTHHAVIDAAGKAMEPEEVLCLFEHFDQPFADTSLIPMYWVAQAIRDRGFSCVLSGDGGDEAFGGYARFWRANRLATLMRLPGWVQTAAASAGDRLSPHTRDWGRQLAKAVRIAQHGREDSSRLIAGLSNFLSEDQKGELMRPQAAAGLATVFHHFDGYDPAAAGTLEELSRRMTENLFAVGLPGDMLRKVDMMSMRASVEIRVPMLDEDVVTVGLGLPHRLKTDGRRGKLVLRELAARWLPRSVAAQPKHGFDIPLDRLLTPRFHAMLADLLLGPDSRTGSFMDVSLVRHWLDLLKRAAGGHVSGAIGRDGLYQRVVIVLALESWMRRHRLSW